MNKEEEFQKVIDLMTENHSKYGSSTASTQMFLKKLKNVKTKIPGIHFYPLVENKFLFALEENQKYMYNLLQLFVEDQKLRKVAKD